LRKIAIIYLSLLLLPWCSQSAERPLLGAATLEIKWPEYHLGLGNKNPPLEGDMKFIDAESQLVFRPYVQTTYAVGLSYKDLAVSWGFKGDSKNNSGHSRFEDYFLHWRLSLLDLKLYYQNYQGFYAENEIGTRISTRTFDDLRAGHWGAQIDFLIDEKYGPGVTDPQLLKTIADNQEQIVSVTLFVSTYYDRFSFKGIPTQDQDIEAQRRRFGFALPSEGYFDTLGTRGGVRPLFIFSRLFIETSVGLGLGWQRQNYILSGERQEHSTYTYDLDFYLNAGVSYPKVGVFGLQCDLTSINSQLQNSKLISNMMHLGVYYRYLY
jgi:hypothetical protein